MDPMVKTIARGLSLLFIVAVTLLALFPWPFDVPAPPDLIGHFGAFLVLYFLSALAYDSVGLLLLWLLFAIGGGVIEFLQMVMGYGRNAGWQDWFADLAGAAVGFLVVWLIRRWVRWNRSKAQAGDMSEEA